MAATEQRLSEVLAVQEEIASKQRDTAAENRTLRVELEATQQSHAKQKAAIEQRLNEVLAVQEHVAEKQRAEAAENRKLRVEMDALQQQLAKLKT